MLGIIVLVIGVTIYLSYGTGYKMVREWLQRDQTQIEENLKRQLSQIQSERDGYKKQLVALKAQRNQLNTEYEQLKEKYALLEKKFAAIPVPDNPDSLVNAFRERGFRARSVLPVQ